MTPIARVERRLSHKPVHAGFRSQPAKCVITLKLNRGPLDTGDLTGRQLGDFRVEAVLFSPAQVHAQEHLRPVLGFRAAGARLNLDVSVRFVHLALEHPAELQGFELTLEIVQLFVDLRQRVVIFFRGRELGQIPKVVQVPVQIAQALYHLLQRGALLVKALGFFGIVPDVGLGEGQLDLGETLLLLGKVKGTP